MENNIEKKLNVGIITLMWNFTDVANKKLFTSTLTKINGKY